MGTRPMAIELSPFVPREFYYEGPGESARTVRLEQVGGDLVISRRFSDGLSLVDETSERFKLADIEAIADSDDRIVVTLKAAAFRRKPQRAF
jgi:voltage-gated potassium channel Kch